ncbi:MAG: hypothetical protein WC081_05665 [Candidatus Ratteibacteria bacterium]|jgi:hypothetical protein
MKPNDVIKITKSIQKNIKIKEVLWIVRIVIITLMVVVPYVCYNTAQANRGSMSIVMLNLTILMGDKEFYGERQDKTLEEDIEKHLKEDRMFVPKEAYTSLVDAYSIYQSIHLPMPIWEFKQKKDEFTKNMNRAKFLLW